MSPDQTQKTGLITSACQRKYSQPYELMPISMDFYSNLLNRLVVLVVAILINFTI